MCNPCHWLPRVTTLSVELSASTPVTSTEKKMTKNDEENYEDDDENYLHQLR